jgi:fusion and transport protein UGO1
MARSSNVRDMNAKRKAEREAGGGKKKKQKSFKRQSSYHSSSEDENDDVQINLKIDIPPPKPEEMSLGNATEMGPRIRRKPIEPTPEDTADVAVKESLADVEVEEEGKAEDEQDIDAEDDEADDEPNLDELSGADSAEDEADSDADSDTSLSDTTSTASANKRKRNDPARFATSISKILDAKLTTTKRADPVLSRSKAASEATLDLAESRLEAKARRKLRDDKKAAKEKGRVKDVMGLQSTAVSTEKIKEEEKRLRKMAQRGVVKLFNAVRAAQVKGEEASRQVKSVDTESHIIGEDGRTERVNELSKKGFLDMLVAEA